MADFVKDIPYYVFPHELDCIVINATNTCTVEFFTNVGVDMILTLTPNADGQIIIEDFAQLLRDITADHPCVFCEIYLKEEGTTEDGAAEFYVRACRQDLNTTCTEFCNKHFFSLVKGPKPTYMGAEELLFADYKEFHIAGHDLAVAQITCVDSPKMLERKDEFLQLMEKTAKEKGFSMMILMLTDVLKEGTQIIYLGSDEVITQAFNVNPKGNTVFLPHVMSRKKQVIPMLSALWG